MTGDREDRERDEQRMRGLRAAGYPSLASPAMAQDPPAAILERQERICGALAEIHASGPCPTANVAPDALPVAEDEVEAWIAESPATRKGLHREVARGLAYLERFKR